MPPSIIPDPWTSGYHSPSANGKHCWEEVGLRIKRQGCSFHGLNCLSWSFSKVIAEVAAVLPWLPQAKTQEYILPCPWYLEIQPSFCCHGSINGLYSTAHTSLKCPCLKGPSTTPLCMPFISRYGDFDLKLEYHPFCFFELWKDHKLSLGKHLSFTQLWKWPMKGHFYSKIVLHASFYTFFYNVQVTWRERCFL